MGARKWSKSFLSPSPSPPSSPMSRDNPESDDDDDATSVLQRSSNLNRQLDLSTREDTAIMPDANPFSLSKKRSAQKGKAKSSSAGGNIRPAGNVRPANARKAQASVPEDTFERKKGWSNGRGESIPPVTKSKRKADDDGGCKQIGGNRLSRDANLPLKNTPKPKPKPSTSTTKKKAPKKKADDDISFHRLPRDSEESRNFPIIAGFARQRTLPTKAEKPEPDINLIVSGHGARVIRTTRKAGPSQRQDASSKSSRSSSSSLPSLQKWLSTTSPPPPDSSIAEQPHIASSPPPVEEEVGFMEDAPVSPAPVTPPPPLVQPGASGYASSAVTTLKTPSTVRRVEREPTPEERPEHIQLLEDMAEQLPQGYSLHEQDDRGSEPQHDLRPHGQAYEEPPESSLHASYDSPAPVPAATRLAQFRFQGVTAPEDSPTDNHSTHLARHPNSHLNANLAPNATTSCQAHPATPRVPLPPAFATPNAPPSSRPLPFRSVARPSFTALPLPQNLTPKISSPAQVVRPRVVQPQPPRAAHPYAQPPPRPQPQAGVRTGHSHPYAQPQPRTQPPAGVRTGHSYVGLYQPKPTYPSNGGRRRLTLAPSRTSYTAGAKVTTWEPTPLSQSRVAAPVPVQQSTYVPRHLRALQQAAEPVPHPRPPVEEDEDWDAEWRR